MAAPTVVIFGGAGFIARAFLRQFAQRFARVVVVDRFSGPSHPRPDSYERFQAEFAGTQVQTVIADAANADALGSILREAHAVLLLNADTGTAQSGLMPQTCVQENVTALVCIAQAIRRHCTPEQVRVVFTSSRAVYGEGRWLCSEHGMVSIDRSSTALAQGRFLPQCPACQRALTLGATPESAARAPLSVYGATKSAGEDLLRTLLTQNGYDLRIVRYQNVYGPGQEPNNPYTGVLNWFSRALLREQDVQIYEGGHIRRDFIYVDDAARLLWRLTELAGQSGAGPLVLNGGAGVAVSLTEVASTLKDLFAARGQISITDKFRVGDVLGACADMSRAEALLGFSCETSLVQGLRRYSDWFRHQTLTD
jgi:dTDP-L-rhamnose 4-epimerase